MMADDDDDDDDADTTKTPPGLACSSRKVNHVVYPRSPIMGISSCQSIAKIHLHVNKPPPSSLVAMAGVCVHITYSSTSYPIPKH